MNLFLLDIIEDTVVDGPGFRTFSMRQDAGIIAPVVIIPNPGNVSMGMRSE